MKRKYLWIMIRGKWQFVLCAFLAIFVI
jgi:hypothetical protein